MIMVIKIIKAILRIIYGVIKLFPMRQNKILFLSRQADELSVDFSLLRDKLNEKAKAEIEIVSICKRFRGKKDGAVIFVIKQLKSLYHLATAKICILDAYWPTVSMLSHKKDMTVIQMWHSLGKIKKSGFQTLDLEGGRSRRIAEALNMHENYDYIIAGGKAWNRYYVEAFRINEKNILNFGLPRLDRIAEKAKDEQATKEFFQRNSDLEDRKIILYVPTYRRYNMNDGIEALAKVFEGKEFAFIYRGHQNQEGEQDLSCDYLKLEDEDMLSLMAAADYVVTDYSSIAIEAAAMDKKILYYLYDYDRYTSGNGINLNLFETMPGCVFRQAEEIYYAVLNDYPYESLRAYKERFLPEDVGTAAEKTADYILEVIKI